jgi:maltooligosyltrehalose trehalohydrolase
VLGASVGAEGVTFRVWTQAPRAAVVLFGRGPGGPTARGEVALHPRGAGVFEATLPLGPGALYMFRVGDRVVPDPYARALPFGVHGPAEVRAPASPGPGGWRPASLAGRTLYELHVGTFTPEGTFAAAAARLPALVDLGVDAVQLLPVASFAGARGWGYDGVAQFAPHAAYGGPDGLRALVDAAHRLGLGVLLDVVYNHFGPEGNYLASHSPRYFTRARATPWGPALNFRAAATRRLVLDSVRHWLAEYGVDGLRLDATHALHDRSRRHILAAIADEARALGPGRVLVVEDETQHPDLVRGAGVDAMWADDFHHLVHTLLTGERDGYYDEYPPTVAALARCIERGHYYEGAAWRLSGRARGGPTDGLPASAFVYCLQNHDQVGNRARGERLHHLVGLDAWCAATALLLFLPTPALLFMGQEWAAGAPWRYFTDLEPGLGARVTAGRRAEFAAFAGFRDAAARRTIPDPQDPATFLASKLDWAERERPPHRGVLALTRALLRLRRGDPVLRHAERRDLSVGTCGPHRLWVRRRAPAGERLLVLDLGPAPDLSPPRAVADRGWTPLLRAGGGELPRARAAMYG